jgi:hypothetical protein
MLARNKLEELSKIDIAAIEAMSDLPAFTELVTWLGQAVGAAEARVALDRALRAYHHRIP